MGNYLAVKELVESGQLRIVGITSPARCASTALEVAIGSNPSCDSIVNQPFGLDYEKGLQETPEGKRYSPPQNREEDAYGLILKAYEEVKGKSPAILVIKEMTRNLGFGEMYERYSALLDKEIFLIRNPYLAVTSASHRLALEISSERKELMEDARGKVHTYQALGYIEGDESYMGNLLNRISSLEFIARGFAYDLNMFIPERVAEFADTLEDYHAYEIGYTSLDAYAEAKHGCTWEDFKERYVKALKREPEAKNCIEVMLALQPLFQDMLAMNVTGWFHLNKIWEKKEGQLNDNQIVVDSTIFRTHPEAMLAKIFEFAGMEKVEATSKFSDRAKSKLAKDVGDSPAALHMHQGVLSSIGIKAAKEPYPETDDIVYPMREHIHNVALPIYTQMLQQSLGVELASLMRKVDDPVIKHIIRHKPSPHSWTSPENAGFVGRESAKLDEVMARHGLVLAGKKMRPVDWDDDGEAISYTTMSIGAFR